MGENTPSDLRERVAAAIYKCWTGEVPTVDNVNAEVYDDCIGLAEAAIEVTDEDARVERDAREAAERERDFYQTDCTGILRASAAEARVADLEEALREIADDENYHPDDWGVPVMYGTQKIARAVLGVQSTPTETAYEEVPRRRFGTGADDE